jgi:hypothetical protein
MRVSSDPDVKTKGIAELSPREDYELPEKERVTARKKEYEKTQKLLRGLAARIERYAYNSQGDTQRYGRATKMIRDAAMLRHATLEQYRLILANVAYTLVAIAEQEEGFETGVEFHGGPVEVAPVRSEVIQS